MIRDVAPDPQTAQHFAEEAIQKRMTYPFWRCIGVGHTSGKQTISRAELEAIIFAVQNGIQDVAVREIHIHTDSQYAINTWNSAGHPALMSMLHNVENSDLVSKMARLKQQTQAQIFLHKVKSHQRYEDISDPYLRWQAFGNNTVDAIVTLALRKLPTDLEKERKACLDQRERVRLRLQKIYEYMADCNLERHKKLQQVGRTNVQIRHGFRKQRITG